MPGSVHRDDPPVVTERTAARERAGWPAVEPDGLRGEPRRQRLAQDTAHDSWEGRRDEPQLGVVDPHRRTHVDETIDVVAVVVSEHYLGDVVERQARARDRSRKLLLGGNRETRKRDVARRGGLAAVD